MNELISLNCPLLHPHNAKLPNCVAYAIVDNANFGIQEDQHEESQDVETTVASYLEQ